MMAKPNEISTFPLDLKAKRLGNSVFSNGIADFTSGKASFPEIWPSYLIVLTHFPKYGILPLGRMRFPKQDGLRRRLLLIILPQRNIHHQNKPPSKTFAIFALKLFHIHDSAFWIHNSIPPCLTNDWLKHKGLTSSSRLSKSSSWSWYSCLWLNSNNASRKK